MDADKENIARTMPVLMREYGIDDYYVQFWKLWMLALRNTQPHLLAYLIYMVQRLLHMKVLLRPTGSLYLHCDPSASHYIKIMMDGIFGHRNFRNDIIWKRTTVHNDSKTWSGVTDNILFYTKSDKFTWNAPREPHSERYIADKYDHDDGDGRRYRLDNMTSPNPRPNMMYEWKGFPFPAKGWRYKQETMQRLDDDGRIWYPTGKDGSLDTSRRPQLKRYLDEMQGQGQVMGNVWTDISPVNSQARERLGYPTQKPISLLDRIIKASSNRGEIVFDPFCGCGTTIYSAIENDRQWIGCDIAILSIRLIRERLTEKYHLVEGVNYEIDGIPVSVEQAEMLFKRDPFQFQHWAVERIGGFPMQKKVADKGIDGRIYFETPKGPKDMVLSVKGGNIRPTDILDLRGVFGTRG
jgi:adenine specific DNA methylase Mod